MKPLLGVAPLLAAVAACGRAPHETEVPRPKEGAASASAPSALGDAKGVSPQGSDASGASAGVEAALRDGIVATFSSDPSGLLRMGWPPSGRAPGADVDVEAVGPMRLVPARSGTRSCSDRAPCDAVVVTVRTVNRGSSRVQFDLREEWHGGALAPTPLVVCARVARPLDAGAANVTCSPAYLVEATPDAPQPSTASKHVDLAAGAAASFDVRLDYAGTGSMIGAPVVDPRVPADHDVAFGLVVVEGGTQRIAVGRAQRVLAWPADGPAK